MFIYLIYSDTLQSINKYITVTYQDAQLELQNLSEKCKKSINCVEKLQSS